MTDTLFDAEVKPDPDATTAAVVDEDVADPNRPTEWTYNEMPLEVLLDKKRARTKMIRYAVNAVAEENENLNIYRNKSSIGERADTTRHAVHRHIDTLVELGIFLRKGGGVERFKPNEHSDIVQALVECNEAVEDRMLNSHAVLELPDDE